MVDVGVSVPGRSFAICVGFRLRPRHVRLAITNGEAPKRTLPASVRIFRIRDRSARVRAEQAIVAPLASQPFSQPKPTLNDRDSTSTQSDAAILPVFMTSLSIPRARALVISTRHERDRSP